jgi:hypothetical protein
MAVLTEIDIAMDQKESPRGSKDGDDATTKMSRRDSRELDTTEGPVDGRFGSGAPLFALGSVPGRFPTAIPASLLDRSFCEVQGQSRPLGLPRVTYELRQGSRRARGRRPISLFDLSFATIHHCHFLDRLEFVFD